MLSELEVRDYALIDNLSIRFGGGFNVLTGETGAGKSLVIDCVGLVIGGRASTDAVRAGSDSATVQALFDTAGYAPIAELLEEQGIDLEPDGVMVVSREVSKQGRSRCRVNGRIVTQSALADIGERLVDIYGQHEYESLARPSRHLALLDAFGGEELRHVKAGFRDLYSQWRACAADLAELRENARERAQRIDILTFQAHEIESAKLESDEDVRLASERTVLANAEKLYDAANRAYSLIYDSSSPDRPAAADLLGEAVAELDAAARIDDSLSGVHGSVAQAADQVAEAARSIREYRDSIDFDPGRLSEVEDRLSLIARLKRKYGDTLEQVIEHGMAARRRLDSIIESDERIAELDAKMASIGTQLAEMAAELTHIRLEVAARLEHDISRELAGLSMPRAVFQVAITRARARDGSAGGIMVDGSRCAVGPDGVDDVEFLFTANKGEEPRPLARIASGGEMSRVMLAIKSVLAVADDMPTMVFDEVDQGIGGEAALAVGSRLAGIGRVRQVLAVTHLPQIAAIADCHYRVAKSEKGGRTGVVVERLDGDERVLEIARMLGGENPSSVTLAHAREMLAKRQRVVEQA